MNESTAATIQGIATYQKGVAALFIQNLDHKSPRGQRISGCGARRRSVELLFLACTRPARVHVGKK